MLFLRYERALNRNNKDWLDQSQNNVSEYGDLSI
jgi:hypothetical protein